LSGNQVAVVASDALDLKLSRILSMLVCNNRMKVNKPRRRLCKIGL
jgi:hypothetical protein